MYIRKNSTPSSGDQPGLDSHTLNYHYVSVSTDSAYIKPPWKLTANGAGLQDLIKPSDVVWVINRISSNASGMDGVKPWFIKLAVNAICSCLASLFNASLHLSCIPHHMKLSIITPVAKVNNASKPEDFRPISVTSIVLHLMECIVARKLIYPILFNSDSYCYLNDQFGFWPSSSCECAVIKLTDIVTNNLAKSRQVDALFLDVSKAFDTLKHYTIAEAISNITAEDFIYNWIVEFLSDRKHCTKWKDEVSGCLEINCSIIQGSILGLTLFIITLSNLQLSRSDVTYVKYTDDTVAVFPGHDSFQISREIKHIVDWMESANLKLNKGKSKLLTFNLSNCVDPAVRSTDNMQLQQDYPYM